jgi:phytol kinase
MELMALVLTVIATFILLVANELWFRHHGTPGELSRKFVHITVGSFAAVWPFFLSWDQIRLLSVAFLIVVAASKYFGLFRALHSVQRPTWGEIFFAVVAGVLTLVTQSKGIFAAALLQMSLADGLAAVIGVRYGKRKYYVFGHTKSYEGTATFFIVSLLLLIGYSTYGHHLMPGSIAIIAAFAAIIENVGIRGSDNLLVPLAVAFLLRLN